MSLRFSHCCIQHNYSVYMPVGYINKGSDCIHDCTVFNGRESEDFAHTG